MGCLTGWDGARIPMVPFSVQMQRNVRASLTRLRTPQDINPVDDFQACAQGALPCCVKQRTRIHCHLHTCMSLVYTSRLALVLSQPIQPISLHFHSSHARSAHPPTKRPFLRVGEMGAWKKSTSSGKNVFFQKSAGRKLNPPGGDGIH